MLALLLTLLGCPYDSNHPTNEELHTNLELKIKLSKTLSHQYKEEDSYIYQSINKACQTQSDSCPNDFLDFTNRSYQKFTACGVPEIYSVTESFTDAMQHPLYKKYQSLYANAQEKNSSSKIFMLLVGARYMFDNGIKAEDYISKFEKSPLIKIPIFQSCL